MKARWKHRPEGSNWGDFGVDDQLGAMNLDGSDKQLLSWITETDVAALISDNFAVELMPKAPAQRTSHPMLPLHEHCLFKNGIHLGELWFLRDLAAWLREHKRSRFLQTAPPLNLPGAVGSPVTPLATV